MALTKIKKNFYLVLFTLEPALLLPALIILYFTKTSIMSLFSSCIPVYLQICLGIISGAAAALLTSLLILRLAFFSKVRGFFESIFSAIDITITDAFWISLLAGVFEEFLFRGAVQPMLGVWLTSFIFILLHGYFNPKSLSMSVFGVLMFGLSCVMGGLALRFGLICAMCFHFAYDFTALLMFLKPGSVLFPRK